MLQCSVGAKAGTSTTTSRQAGPSSEQHSNDSYLCRPPSLVLPYLSIGTYIGTSCADFLSRIFCRAYSLIVDVDISESKQRTTICVPLPSTPLPGPSYALSPVDFKEYQPADYCATLPPFMPPVATTAAAAAAADGDLPDMSPSAAAATRSRTSPPAAPRRTTRRGSRSRFRWPSRSATVLVVMAVVAVVETREGSHTIDSGVSR